MSGDTNVLIIEEIDGDNILFLAQASLPAQGLGVGGSLRSTRTYYPGSNKPSTQVMGTQEEDMTLKGVWRDDQLEGSGAAMVLVQTCRAMLLGQLRCELSWGSDLVRRGFIKSFLPEFDRPSVIRWTLVFQVDEADESTVITTPFPSTATTATLWQQILAVISEIDDVIETVGLASDLVAAVAG